MRNTERNIDILLDFTKLSEPELDYEDAEIILESSGGNTDIALSVSNTSTAITTPVPANVAKKVHPLPSSSQHIEQLHQTTAGTGSKFKLQQNVPDIHSKFQNNNDDALDTTDSHRMPENLAVATTDRIKNGQGTFQESAAFDYEMVISVDKLLEEAYFICDRFQKILDCHTRAKLLNLILTLKELPHLYEHVSQKVGRSARVLDWLNNTTSLQEPEMIEKRWQKQEPVEPRTRSYDIQHRLSASETNIVLGKRKRSYEGCSSDDITSIRKSSSDTNAYATANWSRTENVSKRCRRARD